jgi:hypothetical protein
MVAIVIKRDFNRRSIRPLRACPLNQHARIIVADDKFRLETFNENFNARATSPSRIFVMSFKYFHAR